MDERDVLLRDVSPHPDFGQVGHDEEFLSRLDDFPTGQVASDDAAGEGGHDRHVGPNVPALVEATKFFIAHAEQFQVIARLMGLRLHAEQFRLPALGFRLTDDLFLQQELCPRIGLLGDMEFGPRLQVGGLGQSQFAAV